MKIEPSDIIKLLGMLSHEYDDFTCHALRDHAERGTPILDICHEAIRVLAAEKHAMRKMATQAMAMKPLPMLVTKDEADRLGITLPCAGENDPKAD